MTREQIVDLFTDPVETMTRGLWFSGIKYEGEYKEWHYSGQLYTHSFYKGGKLHGKFKTWNKYDDLVSHRLYKDGRKVEDYIA